MENIPEIMSDMLQIYWECQCRETLQKRSRKRMVDVRQTNKHTQHNSKQWIGLINMSVQIKGHVCTTREQSGLHSYQRFEGKERGKIVRVRVVN